MKLVLPAFAAAAIWGAPLLAADTAPAADAAKGKSAQPPAPATETTPAAPASAAPAAPGAATPGTPDAAATPGQTTPAPVKKLPARIKFTPPAGSLGAAASNSSGGTRAANSNLPEIRVLVPKEGALTTQEQPALFWYQSAPTTAAFELTLNEPKKPKPLLSVKLPNSQKAGIRAISLIQQNVKLEPGIEYVWHVALIPNPADRSLDSFSTGVIKRVAAKEDLQEELSKSTPAEQAALYAQGGYWYDALQAISTAIAAEPKNVDLHKLRADLLTQGDLGEVAKTEH